ncbi:MAG: HDOD domain-containing protein [Thermodesulfovibrionales bacterium]|nr:HDOD domain-containing protein [Thermodesulfovibrionales bacterium]
MESDIKAKISELTSLSTLPIIISRLLKVISNENATLEELIEVIRHDQSLASRVVSIANSPFFGYPGRINSLEQAVLMLGFNIVKSISLGISIFTMFPIPYKKMKKMWAHAFNVATLSALFSHKFSPKNSSICFLSGLLHDIGRAVLLTIADSTQLSPFIQQQLHLKSAKLLELETKVFRCNHIEAGTWFLERLFFPQEIILPVYYHHHLDRPTYSKISHRDIVSTIFLCEGLIDILTNESPNDGEWGENHILLMESLGIYEKDLDEIKQKFLSMLETTNVFFNLS